MSEYVAVNLPKSGQMFEYLGGPCMVYHQGRNNYTFFYLNIGETDKHKAKSIEEVLNKYHCPGFKFNDKPIFEKQEVQICYKVVSVKNNKFYSAAAQYCQLSYKLHEMTKPEFGKIFVFDSLSAAVHFVKNQYNNTKLSILKCECSDMTPIRQREYSLSDSQHMQKFWESDKYKTVGGFFSVPKSTFGVDWVKPLEIVSC